LVENKTYKCWSEETTKTSIWQTLRKIIINLLNEQNTEEWERENVIMNCLVSKYLLFILVAHTTTYM